MKFLVVDDSVTMRRIIINVLKGMDYVEVVEAENGEEALRKLKQGGVSVIITDWNMPVMGGLEMVQAVRAEDKTTPILMVTTNATNNDVIEALKAGVNNYVVKPFTTDTLKDKLQALLGQR